jgi:two-component system, sensor histidine kinase
MTALLFPSHDVPPQALGQNPLTDRQIILDYGLRAQVRMLGYALGFFMIGLPIYIWAASTFMSVTLIGLNLIYFIAVWAAFFLIKPSLSASHDETAKSISGRLRRQWLCGALWALSLLILSTLILNSHTSPYLLLVICSGASVGVIFFSAPVLLHLLTLGPLAMIGPILVLRRLDGQSELANIIMGGLALAMAFALILNRHLQEHYQLEFNQLKLSREREVALKARDELSHAQYALMQTLSREVTTGLKTIEQGLNQGLKHLVKAPAPRHCVEDALGSVETLLGMMTTTLDNDTAQHGKLSVKLLPINVETIAMDLIDGYQSLAQAKGLDLSLKATPLVSGAAIADPARVEQILSHLLANALHYTPKGRVEVKILAPQETILRIEVVDSGPGLSAEELQQAFRAHERILRTSSGHSGAGLGLSLSQALASLMKAHLGAESTTDVGSKFWLDLHFDPDAKCPASPKLELETLNKTPESSPLLKILLLSNDPLRSAQLRQALEGLGHKCLTSTTRERALTLAQKVAVDAILISTGGFEDLGDNDQKEALEDWFRRLRETQTETRLNILALIPNGEHASPLSHMGIHPLLLPQSTDGLQRALMQSAKLN